MTEAEWMACESPWEMIRLAQRKFTVTKHRLLGCAFCRRVWDLIDDPIARSLIEIAERYEEGTVSHSEFVFAWEAAWPDGSDPRGTIYHSDSPACYADHAARLAVFGWAEHAAEQAVIALAYTIKYRAFTPEELAELERRVKAIRKPEITAQVGIVRCVFGNPFRPIALAPAWLTTSVRQLAEAIYAERTFERLPILADALEEAGCDNGDVLGHCRQGGEHVRGCWVVDLVLGRE